MPTYVYKCNECDIIEEYRLPVNHRKPYCPNCGKEMEIVIQPVGVIFKGLDFPGNDLKRYNAWKRGEKTHEEG